MESKSYSSSKLIFALPVEQRTSVPFQINATSRSHEEWSKQLSPFFLGPIQTPDGHFSKNFENVWQYSKVYEEHMNRGSDDPNESWRRWSREGFENANAVRFPMGRGAKPLYSYWDGHKYGYIDARINIYAPVYAALVEKTPAFQRLKNLYEKHKGNICLFDFDGYDYHQKGMSLEDCLYDERKKMGHGFVLMMLLKGERYCSLSGAAAAGWMAQKSR
eukprot:TRINITY_DN3728_c0_g1_i2.p1 TRINITY_DN3728_c0_g1~~TRINITY_DN3728_c0_g1_i2.p1  ORF type:complete len:218 (+),score=32.32 TRINITY_DN3728_c0_g1_i2:1-654(+)